MIGAYGHDDRVCGYAAMKALLDLDEVPGKTSVCVLADKEEVGSMGVSGMLTAAFDTFMEDLCDSQNVPVRVCLEKSFCLSADVTAAFDPNFGDVYEKRRRRSRTRGHRGRTRRSCCGPGQRPWRSTPGRPPAQRR